MVLSSEDCPQPLPPNFGPPAVFNLLLPPKAGEPIYGDQQSTLIHCYKPSAEWGGLSQYGLSLFNCKPQMFPFTDSKQRFRFNKKFKHKVYKKATEKHYAHRGPISYSRLKLPDFAVTGRTWEESVPPQHFLPLYPGSYHRELGLILGKPMTTPLLPISCIDNRAAGQEVLSWGPKWIPSFYIWTEASIPLYNLGCRTIFC